MFIDYKLFIDYKFTINKEENGFVDLELAGKVSRHAMTVPRNSVHVNAAPSAWNG